MAHAQQMLQTNPSPAAVDASALAECVEACLGEDEPKPLVRCVRLNLDCADVCDATGRILSRQTAFGPEVARAALRACAEACRLCGEECEQHGQHGIEHCRVCAEACRRCEQACGDALSAILA